MARSTRILVGLTALVLAAILFVAGEFVLARGDLLMNPAADPEAFARMVTGGGFTFYAARGLAGAALEAYGMIAIYLYLEPTEAEPWAFWGMLVSVVGDLGGALFFGLMLFVYPSAGTLILDGQTEVAEILALPMGFLGVMFLVTVVGLACLAVAIWRADRLPRWSGIVMLVGFLVLLVQVFAVQIAGNVLWGLGALWILIDVWRTPNARRVP